jgi:ankyrin repeat protein
VKPADLERTVRFVHSCFAGDLAAAEAVLAQAPALPRRSVHAAAACADAAALAAHLKEDPSRARAPLPPAGVTPLLALCLSAYVRPGAPRAGRAGAAALLLLDAGADPRAAVARAGKAPLVPLAAAAALARDADLARLLLARGADPEEGGALAAAVRGSSFELAELLLAHGARVDASGGDPRDATPLFTVLDAWYDEARLAFLLARGADVERRAGPHGETALHVAARRRRPEAVRLLAERGADLRAPNRGGKTAFQHAARRGFDDVCAALRAAGATEALAPGDRFAAHLAAGELEAARALAHGSPVDRDNPEETRLLPDLAGRPERREELVLLLELGLPLDARGLDGGTALHQAAWFGAPDNLELLLARGAPLELLCEEHGSTPLGWVAHGSRYSGGAAERQAAYVRAAELLLAAGASLAHPLAPEDDSAAWLLEDASDEVARVLRRALGAR